MRSRNNRPRYLFMPNTHTHTQQDVRVEEKKKWWRSCFLQFFLYIHQRHLFVFLFFCFFVCIWWTWKMDKRGEVILSNGHYYKEEIIYYPLPPQKKKKKTIYKSMRIKYMKLHDFDVFLSNWFFFFFFWRRGSLGIAKWIIIFSSFFYFCILLCVMLFLELCMTVWVSRLLLYYITRSFHLNPSLFSTHLVLPAI